MYNVFSTREIGVLKVVNLMLTARQMLIFKCIVEEFIENAEPVGSKALMVKYQLPVTMTSGYRKDDKTSNGSDSKHASGNAMDIVPMKGYSFEEIKSMIRNTPEIFDYMKANGIGLFDETSQETLAKTKGTGPHFHIGTDKVALKFFEV